MRKKKWIVFAAIVMMIIFTVLTYLNFRRILRTAGWAMLVYLAWLIFAAYLNLAIVILN